MKREAKILAAGAALIAAGFAFNKLAEKAPPLPAVGGGFEGIGAGMVLIGLMERAERKKDRGMKNV